MRGRQPLPLKPFLALLAALLAVSLLNACTITGAEREATKNLHWFAFKSHTDLEANTRWQFAPGTRVAVEALAPAADERWLAAASDGVYGTFEPPGESAELLLLISWPQDRLEGSKVGGWLRPSSDPLDVEVKLVDLSYDRVVQTARLRVDPHWFSRHDDRPGQIRNAFAQYAASIATSR